MSYEKSALRMRMLDTRDENLSKEERKRKSSRIASQFINDLLLPAKVNSVGLYYPIRSEVDTFSVFDFCLKNSIKCLFPRVISEREMVFLSVHSKRELVRRKHGIYEPDVGVFAGERGEVPEILIVPGVVFDLENFRIGYGKGFYDRYLSRSKPLLTVGFSYHFQMIENIKVDGWDIRLDLVLTEKGWQGDFKNIFAGGSRWTI